MGWFSDPLALVRGPWMFTDEISVQGIDLHPTGVRTDGHLLVKECLVHAVICIIKPYMVIAVDLGFSTLHEVILCGWESLQFADLFLPVVVPAMRFCLEGRAVQLRQFIPKVIIELVKTEVLPLLQIMEESFLHDTDRIFDATLVLGFPHFSR